jgi:hypothetical protein
VIANALDQVFDCNFCRKKHTPSCEEDFPTNQVLLKLLKARSDKVYRGEQIKKLTEKLMEIKDKCNELKLNLDNGTDKVKEHCIHLRSQVHLATDVLIEDAHKFNESLIAEIDKYEQECTDSFNSMTTTNDNKFDKFIVDLNEFHSVKIKYLTEFDVKENVVEEALAKADSYLRDLNIKERSLKNIQYNGKVAEFKKCQNKINRTSIGTLEYKSFELDNLKKLVFNNDIIDNYSSCVNLFKRENGHNFIFYIDSNHNLNMCSFDNDGTIVRKKINSLEYSGSQKDASQITQFRIAQISNYFIIHVDFRVFKTTDGRDYVYRTICGHDIEIHKKSTFIKGLFFVINHDFCHVQHNYDFRDEILLHMAANSSTIIWVDSNYSYHCLDMYLAVKENNLEAITTQVGSTIIDVQMSDEYVFFLCNHNKLKIFEIESGDIVNEIETFANQIKQLAPVGRFALYDSVNRIVHLLEQVGGFCKIKDIYLPESFEPHLTINRDKSNFLVFYNSKYMNYLSL